MTKGKKEPGTGLAAEDGRWREAYLPIADLLEEVEDRIGRRESVEAFARLVGVFPEAATIDDAESYVLHSGGKRLRAALCMLATEICGGDPVDAIPLAVGIELFHAATLVLDDLIEDADMRRGKPAVHRIWGDPGALVTAIGLNLRALPSFFESMLSTGKNGAPSGASRLVSAMGQTVARVLWGEIMQHRTRMQYDLHEDIYRRIVTDKSSSLFELCCVGGGLISASKNGHLAAMEKYGSRLGVAFQISDDVLDLEGEKKRLGKMPGSDLKEGRATLPLIYYFRDCNDLQRREMARMLPPLHKPPLPREKIVELLIRSGALDQCRKAAKLESGKARRALTGFPDGRAKRSLRLLATLASDRSK